MVSALVSIYTVQVASGSYYSLLTDTVPRTECEGLERGAVVLCKLLAAEPTFWNKRIGLKEVGFIVIRCELCNPDSGL